MKKNLLHLSIILLIVLLFGCGETRRIYIQKRPKIKVAPRAKALVKKPADKKEPEAAPAPEVAADEESDEFELIEYKSAEDLFYSAIKSYNEERYDTSFILFDQILKQYPDDILAEDSLIYQARMLYMKQLYARALKSYEDILTLFPETRFNEEIAYYIYLCYAGLNQNDKAKAKRDEFVEMYPDSKFMTALNLDIANDLYKEAEYAKAIEHYLKYYSSSDDEELKLEVFETVVDIIDNIFTMSELEEIAEKYYDKFPTAYIKLSLAKSYLNDRNVDATKYTLLEIEEFFPTFEKLDEVHGLLDRLVVRAKTKPNVIACLLPLSGKYEAYGKRLLDGILLGMDVFSPDNESEPLTIIIKDTKGDPETALKMLDEAFAKDEVLAVIGPLLSKNAQVCAERAEELKLPIMLLTQKENITDGYEYVYRKFITNTKQVNSLLDYSMDDKGLSRYAIMYPDNTYGRELTELFFNEVINRGGQIIAVEAYDVNNNDFSKEIKKLVGLDRLSDRKRLREQLIEEIIADETIDMQYMVDTEQMTVDEVAEYLDKLKQELEEEDYAPVVDFQAIFVPDNYKRAGLIIPQLLYHDIDKNVLKLGTSGYNSKKLIERARDNANGIVFVDSFFANSRAVDVKSFVSEYEMTFQTAPTLLEAESYDSVKIIIGLIREKGLQDREELKYALDNLVDYDGVTSVVNSFVNGDADEDLILLTVRRQRIRELIRNNSDQFIVPDIRKSVNESGAD